MMRGNHSKVNRPKPNFLIIAISITFIVALGLVFWPRGNSSLKKKITPLQKTKKSLNKAQIAANKKIEVRQTKEQSEEIQGFSGKIVGPLPHSLRRGMDKQKATFLSALAARILIWRLDLRHDLRKNDHIRLLYTKVNTQSRYQIEAMTYHSLKYGKTFRFYRFKGKHQKFAAYYDRNGTNVELRLRNSPIKEYEQVTSILKMRPHHKGVDFKAPVGTKIYLPWRARVLKVNWNVRFNGKSIEVVFLRKPYLHGIFLHLSKVMPIVRRGRILKAGTIIGEVGNTGHSTAAHLHYQLQNRRKKIYDPFKVHQTYSVKLAPEDMPAFKERRRWLDEKLAAIH